MAVHCPECGFVNARARTTARSAAAIVRPEGGDEPTTMTYMVDERREMDQVDIDEVVEKHGAALVIRSGGGRAGESFTLEDEGVRRAHPLGRGNDDVTVSRNHALPVRRRQGGLYIDDLGSLNGTYVNRRHRVPPAHGRRRDPDRQVQAELPGGMSAAKRNANTGVNGGDLDKS